MPELVAARWLTTLLTMAMVGALTPSCLTSQHRFTREAASVYLCELPTREVEPIRAVGGPLADIYGELTEKGFRTLAKRMGLRPGDTFLDLGSGHGKLVIAASKFYGVSSSVGIELSPSRHHIAQRALAASPAHVRRRCSMVCGDLASPGLIEAVGPTAVYVCNIMFSDDLTNRIALQLSAVTNLRVLAAVVPFALGSLPDFVADDSPALCEMSWGRGGRPTGMTIYHRIDDSGPHESPDKPHSTVACH